MSYTPIRERLRYACQLTIENLEIENKQRISLELDSNGHYMTHLYHEAKAALLEVDGCFDQKGLFKGEVYIYAYVSLFEECLSYVPKDKVLTMALIGGVMSDLMMFKSIDSDAYSNKMEGLQHEL